MTLHVCKHSNQLCNVIFVIFFNFSTMTPLYRHLSVVSSTGNCKLGHDTADGCVHTSRRRCVHTADTTQIDIFVASASCIGHYPTPIPAKIWGVPFGVDPSCWAPHRVKWLG